jgi:hypothetical protein
MPMDFATSKGALASMVPVLALGTSCQTDDDGDDSFRITAIDFDGESTITLTFSQSLADLGDVDPNSFRLSFAVTYQFTYTYDGTTYVEETTNYFDLGEFVSDDYYDFVPVTVTSLTPGSSANRIILETSHVWGAAACESLAYIEAMMEMYPETEIRSDVGMFLHYAGGEVPIESASGSMLADIGAEWVLSSENGLGVYEYGFANLHPQLRIPCE